MTIRGTGTILILVAVSVVIVMIAMAILIGEYFYSIRPCLKECDVYQATRIYGTCHCKIEKGWINAEFMNKTLPKLPKKKKRRGRRK